MQYVGDYAYVLLEMDVIALLITSFRNFLRCELVSVTCYSIFNVTSVIN